ncbi:MAG: SsrA-binding protein SmpB [Candidatus Parcubacteria bacterium]|jgi:SsrA-binding protein|nr:MAG: SsrA-binding protein SmpB [Candidatus Parcubacteria bacterium]
MPILATNKRASFDYNFLETYEAGLVLFGHEVKAIKDGHVSLKESFVSIQENKGRLSLFLVGAHISRYRYAGALDNYEPTRSRKLLLRQEEIDRLIGKMQSSGLTLVPVKLYTKHSLIKVELALAQGKRKFDKREALKKRDIDRQIKTALKQR